jgi:thioredoxin reductase (NADPH)
MFVTGVQTCALPISSKPLIRRVEQNPKISILWNKTITEILGTDSVTGVQLQDLQTKEVSELAVQGVFVAIGHQPNTSLFADQIALDEKGYIQSDGTKTSVEGVFVAGDVEDVRYRQAVTAAGSGCRAALDVERWLSDTES